MDFKFPVNDILEHEITCIDGSLIPEGFKAGDRKSAGECQEKVSIILDDIGVSSGIAQGLQSPVTSSERLRNSDHRVYLLTSPSSGASGLVIGLLKVGHKKLYVYDQAGRNHELQPLCVLDFYVHESVQRHGCGKHLYDYMLQAEGVKVEHLALDRPSEKLLSFLRKHYNLERMITQSNNFVVYDRFFDSRPDEKIGYSKHIPLDYGCGRPAAGQTTRTARNVPASGRALVSNRPHSSISKIMESNGGYKFHDGRPSMKGDAGSPGHVTPVLSRSPSPAPTPISCAAAVEANGEADIPVHRDIKFQHQRLW